MADSSEEIDYTDGELAKQQAAISHFEKLLLEAGNFTEKLLVKSNIATCKRMLSKRKRKQQKETKCLFKA